MKTVSYFPLIGALLALAACTAAPTPQRPAAPPPTATRPAPQAPTSIPTAAELGTAQPAAPTPSAGVPAGPASDRQIAFIDSDGNIRMFLQSRRAVVPLTAQGGAVDLALSPDGNSVLYRKDLGSGIYELWIAPADGSGERALVTEDELSALDPEAFGVSLWRYQWLPGGDGFLFNTQEVFDEGPGLRLYEDLHRFDLLTGAFETILAAGSGGGKFAVSPDGSLVAFSRPDNINLIGAEGGGLLEDLVAFPKVLTYSEYLYYPDLLWEPDSAAFWVVVPPSDPLQVPVLPTMIYRVAAEGTSERVALLGDAAFFGQEVRLSADFTLAAFVRMLGDLGDNQRELIIARFDGSEPRILASTAEGTFDFAWAPGEQELLIAQSGCCLYRAQVIGGDVRMEAIREVQDTTGLRWVGDNGYAAWVLEEGGWSLVYVDEIGRGEMRIVEGFAEPTALDVRID